MSPRFTPLARFPLRTSLASTRATIRLNSNTSTSSSRAARVMQTVAQADKPSAAEAAVPVMWAVCGGLACMAWGRMDERVGTDSVDKLLIV